MSKALPGFSGEKLPGRTKDEEGKEEEEEEGQTMEVSQGRHFRFGHHGMEAVQVRQAGDGGESGFDARVRELSEALAKLAAKVMRRNSVPWAVQAVRWITADEIEDV